MEQIKDKWDKVIEAEAKENWFGLRNIWKYRDLIFMFVKKEIIIYYKQTILGPLWFLIQPLIATVMYMFVFGKLANIGTDGIPQILFYFSGTMLWTFFSETFLKVANVFNENKSMFGKVYFPRIVVPLSIVIVNMVKLLIQCALFILMYAYYLCKGYDLILSWRILCFPLIVIWIGTLAMGLGLTVTSITTKYRDLALVLSHLVSLLMYATPVVYPMSELTGRFEKILYYNPMSAPLEVFRYCVYGTGDNEIVFIFISLILCMVIIFLGLYVFGKNEKTFVDVI